jgi:Uma2 family endonuclease
MSIAEFPRAESDARAKGDDPLFEIINGQVVELPPMSLHANKIATRLVWKLGPFIDGKGLGTVVSEALFRLPLEEDAHRNRRPDVAFVSYQRWPKDRQESVRDNAWDVVPDLAIEVVSPNDSAEDLMDKVDEYFSAGVRQVWVVYPRRRLVQVYDSLQAVRAVGEADTLDAAAVLPGFQLPLREVFVFPTIADAEAERGDE